jgi:plasmid maintenance system antidote protein VapI
VAKRKTLVDVLRQAIRESGRTHYAIAKEAGVLPEQLDRFVTGERSLKIETAAKVAEVLGLELIRRK